jgi:hypothetical protein
MKEMLNNPIVKAWLSRNFAAYLQQEKIKGIFLTLDDSGKIAAIDLKETPTEAHGK